MQQERQRRFPFAALVDCLIDTVALRALLVGRLRFLEELFLAADHLVGDEVEAARPGREL